MGLELVNPITIEQAKVAMYCDIIGYSVILIPTPKIIIRIGYFDKSLILIHTEDLILEDGLRETSSNLVLNWIDLNPQVVDTSKIQLSINTEILDMTVEDFVSLDTLGIGNLVNDGEIYNVDNYEVDRTNNTIIISSILPGIDYTTSLTIYDHLTVNINYTLKEMYDIVTQIANKEITTGTLWGNIKPLLWEVASEHFDFIGESLQQIT